jgi:hypothetical protein
MLADHSNLSNPVENETSELEQQRIENNSDILIKLLIENRDKNLPKKNKESEDTTQNLIAEKAKEEKLKQKLHVNRIIKPENDDSERKQIEKYYNFFSINSDKNSKPNTCVYNIIVRKMNMKNNV